MQNFRYYVAVRFIQKGNHCTYQDIGQWWNDIKVLSFDDDSLHVHSCWGKE